MKYGVSVLVLNSKEEVLVTQRQDLRTWVFPGGGCHKGESLEGVNFFFLADEVGGKLKRQKGETLNLRWAKKEELAGILTKKHYQRFQDAFSGDKKIKLRISRKFPLSFSQMPAFFWRRYLGKWLRLARV